MVRLPRAAADAQTPMVLLQVVICHIKYTCNDYGPTLMPNIYICPAETINIYVHASWIAWDLLDIAIRYCNLQLASHNIPPNLS